MYMDACGHDQHVLTLAAGSSCRTSAAPGVSGLLLGSTRRKDEPHCGLVDMPVPPSVIPSAGSKAFDENTLVYFGLAVAVKSGFERS